MFGELRELGDQMADGLQRQHHDTARHQAPEAGNDGGERPKAEVAALDAAAADGVAHDDEGRGEYQKRHRCQRLPALGLVQQLEACRLQGQLLIAAGQQPRHRKANCQRQ